MPHSRLTLAFGLLLAACGSDPGAMDLMSRRLALVPELRVGSIDDPATALTAFRSLEVGRDGRIYTLHPEEGRIRVHDRQGIPLPPIGRQGEGPGEFTRPSVMGVHADSVWVLDFGNYRFSYFDSAGAFLTSKAVPVDLGGSATASPPRPIGLLADGSILGTSPAWSREVAAGSITETVLLRLDDRGQPQDTVASYSLVNSIWAIEDPKSSNGFGSYGQQPFSDTEILRLSPTALEVVRVDRRVAGGPEAALFRVSRATLAGDTIFSREYAYTPIPIDPALVDSLVRKRGESMSQVPFPGAPTPARAAELARASLYLPAFHPPVSELLIGRDGSVWLKREQVSADGSDWLVLSPQGAIVGAVRTPPRLRVMAAEERRIWGMEQDDLDVPYLVRYGVQEEGGAS
jgi:hypothetical protein